MIDKTDTTARTGLSAGLRDETPAAGKKSAAPTRLEFNADVYGRSLPLWHYTSLPEGMRRAQVKDLTRARPVLYRVEAGPDKGDWYSDYVRESTYRLLCKMIQEGKEVWIQ